MTTSKKKNYIKTTTIKGGKKTNNKLEKLFPNIRDNIPNI